MSDMSEQPPYKMSISLNALNHLGINLYSNVPAVLSELIANAYDADASSVRIDIDTNRITIQDDGEGMSRAEINDRYLTIGYDRRKNQPGRTGLNREPMGRKGIGKLAVFSIADTVEVYSVKRGERNGLRMSKDAIEKLIASEKAVGLKTSSENSGGDHSYRPEPLETDRIEFDHGTLLILSDLKRKRTTSLTDDFVKRRLARRFTIVGARHGFNIFINGQELTAKDRSFYSSLEFIWYFDTLDTDIRDECKKLKRETRLSGKVVSDNGYHVTGWIGTVGEPGQLGDKLEEGNSIVVFARGKLIQENILPEFKEARVFAQYLIGDIQADFIDLDDQDDLATSDRQRLVSDDPRYEALKRHINDAIKAIGNQWTEFRREEGSKRALENPIVKNWYEGLSPDNRKYAKQLFGRIESLPVTDKRSTAELTKASILAFEKMALTGHISALLDISTDEGMEALLALFQSVDDLEAAHYHEISLGRLEVIRKFQGLVDSLPKERLLQQYLFDHLWLLDPSWERATNTERLEQTVHKELAAVTESLTDEERNGRIDIRYSTFAGKHVIVELKRYEVKINVHDLAKQIGKYRSALRKALNIYHPPPHSPSPYIEVVCVLGSAPTGEDLVDVEKTLAASDARFVTYDNLIDSAQRAYSDYIQKDKAVSRVRQILSDLDSYYAQQFAPSSSQNV